MHLRQAALRNNNQAAHTIERTGAGERCGGIACGSNYQDSILLFGNARQNRIGFEFFERGRFKPGLLLGPVAVERNPKVWKSCEAAELLALIRYGSAGTL